MLVSGAYYACPPSLGRRQPQVYTPPTLVSFSFRCQTLPHFLTAPCSTHRHCESRNLRLAPTPGRLCRCSSYLTEADLPNPCPPTKKKDTATFSLVSRHDIRPGPLQMGRDVVALKECPLFSISLPGAPGTTSGVGVQSGTTRMRSYTRRSLTGWAVWVRHDSGFFSLAAASCMCVCAFVDLDQP